MDYFSGARDCGEPQTPGHTWAQTARNQAGIYRPQNVNDGVAQLGRTSGQTARNQGGMQHGLLSLMAAREGTVPSGPTSQEPSSTLAPGEIALDAELVFGSAHRRIF